MNPDYSDFTPREPGAAQKLFEETIAKVRTEHTQALNRWLEKRILEFCPEAIEAIKCGERVRFSFLLNARDFYYRSQSDGIVEFCQGYTVLARARFELKFTQKLSVEYPKVAGLDL